ncbi:2-hydroxyacid dehydrogenase [Larsenimonas salina]|uniref:2-hydroxyacid dehydrogenase n=1 Tax=Larsenimonas salina TaxID=1295565 RepID=UPI002073382D|nr:glyoxylate/hydroxypyruvate reductase A [Larsenimonas salina]MCM5705385.1 glyoxylate/hydroxypyruvate reductase A [Larsenimonas salina]
MHVLIHTDNDSARWQRVLANALPKARIDTTAEVGFIPATYLVVWQPPTALLDAQTETLKAILNLGAGVDALLSNPALPDVPLYKIDGGGMEASMADYMLYAVLHFYRGFDVYRAQQSTRQWQPQPLEEKRGWPVTVLGLGTIGAHVATLLCEHGFAVAGWSRSPKALEGVDCYAGMDILEPLLRRTRLLINLLPTTEATIGLLNHERLAHLPEGAVVINAGRGATLELTALSSLLERGHLRGAMLDVFPSEPLAPDHPIYTAPNVTLTPHIAAPTPIDDAAVQLAARIERLERGECVPGVDRRAGY